MEWYWYLVIYIVGWVLTAAWLHMPDRDDDYTDIAKCESIALFWPIIIPMVILGIVVIGFSKLMRKIFR